MHCHGRGFPWCGAPQRSAVLKADDVDGCSRHPFGPNGKPRHGASREIPGGPTLLLLKNLLFTVLVPGTVAVLIPPSLSPDRLTPSAASAAAASAFFLVGAAVYVWCVWDFASFGRGTPAPIDPPQKLVVRGLYQFSRNPMYVGVLTVILAWAVLFASAMLVIYAAFVASCFQSFVVLYEEPSLEREFGEEYLEYKSKVGRWLSRPAG